MRKFAIMTLLAFAAPALAEDIDAKTVMGTTLEQVQTKLVEMGYEVRKAEMEDGQIEVYFVRNGKMGEVYVSPETGRITKLDVKS